MNSNAALSVAALPSAVLDRAAMTRAVEIAANVVEKRGPEMIRNVRLMEDGGDFFAIATNLDTEIVVTIPAAVDAGFDIAVPADLLKTILKGAPKAEHVAFTMPPEVTHQRVVDHERDACGVYVTDDEGHRIPIMQDYLDFDGETAADFDRATYDLVCAHPETWPDLMALSHNESSRFALPGAVLLDSLNAVSKAISNEETRYYLNGVCVQGHADGLRFVATDGHRLMGQVVEAPEGAADLPTAIWPKQFVYLLQKLMKGKNCPESVSIMVDTSKIRVQFGDITITSKLIDGTFPDVDRVTPRHNDKIVSASISTLQEAAAAVALIGKPGGVKFEFNGDGCTLSKMDANNGRARMSVAVDQRFEGEFEIGFNARYFDDILEIASAGGDGLTLALNDSSAPALITGAKAGWYAVLMPMRT